MKKLLLILAVLSYPTLSLANDLPCAFKKARPDITSASFTGGMVRSWDTLIKVCGTYTGICPTQAEIDSFIPECHIDKLRERKIREVKREGVIIITAIDPSLDTLDKAKTYAHILDILEEAGVILNNNDSRIQSVRDIGKNYLISLGGYTTQSQFDNFSTAWE